MSNDKLLEEVELLRELAALRKELSGAGSITINRFDAGCGITTVYNGCTVMEGSSRKKTNAGTRATSATSSRPTATKPEDIAPPPPDGAPPAPPAPPSAPPPPAPPPPPSDGSPPPPPPPTF